MPSEASAGKLRSPRRWSRADSGCEPWEALAVGGAARASGGAASRAPPWGPRELAMAARLLEQPALPVSFHDDQEMRRVYSLIYDVFRYKCVLEEALVDAGYYNVFSEAKTRKSLAWLLLLDQQRRRWSRRDAENELMDSDRRNSDPAKRSLLYTAGSKASSDPARASRESSVESKYLPNSMRAKIKAARDSSLETVEAIRAMRASSTVQSSFESTDSCAEAPKANGAAHRLSISSKSSDESEYRAQLMVEKDDITKNYDIAMKNAQEKLRLAREKENVSNISSFISRKDMQKAMEDVAGELSATINKYDQSLWDCRVRISAAIAKLRIQSKALTLSELLPPHLRDEKVSHSVQREVLTGWVNVFRSRSISELVQRLNEMGFSYSTATILESDQFRFDRLCPKFVSLRPAFRSEFIQSRILEDNTIVLQEREFCLGAAALCRALRVRQLRGDVVQTHGTSPRAAAYLASQLQDRGPDAGGLVIFGAGDRKAEYESFLEALGATNARVVAEAVGEAAPTLWAGAVAALAAPPNSYSAVADPIDLVCSRGGDLSMLEVLTESEMNLDGKNRVMKILEEQKKTLRLCMSKPQIQMVVYETHSALSAENSDMVRRAVAEANRAVRELHALRRQRAREAMPRAPKCAKHKSDAQQSSGGSSDSEADSEPRDEGEQSWRSSVAKQTPRDKARETPRERAPAERSPTRGKATPRDRPPEKTLPKTMPSFMEALVCNEQKSIDPDTEYADVKVPDCDLFEEHLPAPLDGLAAHEREGCYLALIQRKELIRMNHKYMIKVAEQRGLFGGNAPPARRPPPARSKPAHEASRSVRRRLSASQRRKLVFDRNMKNQLLEVLAPAPAPAPPSLPSLPSRAPSPSPSPSYAAESESDDEDQPGASPAPRSSASTASSAARRRLDDNILNLPDMILLKCKAIVLEEGSILDRIQNGLEPKSSKICPSLNGTNPFCEINRLRKLLVDEGHDDDI